MLTHIIEIQTMYHLIGSKAQNRALLARKLSLQPHFSLVPILTFWDAYSYTYTHSKNSLKQFELDHELGAWAFA